MLLPVPAGVPPQESVNHSTESPLPKNPPLTVKVVELPLQIVFVPEILVGAVENVFTVTVEDAQLVLLHVPLYLTKYVVFDKGETVILFPVPALTPPHDPENHSVVPPVPINPPLATKVVESPSQIVLVPIILVGATETVSTATVIVAQLVVLHVPLYLTKYGVSLLGETVILFPVPTLVPPQDPENHWAVAPVPALPPLSVSVVELPLHTVEIPVILVGAVEAEFILTVTEAQVVVLQVPLYRTKYVVSTKGETVMLLPVPALVPPHDPENHSAVAPVPAVPPLKVNVVESPLQIEVVPEMLVGATEVALTVTVAETQEVVLQVPLYRTK